MAARSGSQGRVAVLDVRHELQIVFAQRPGCVDELQAHLSGEAEGCRVDLDNPGHARHVKDGSIRRSAPSQRMIASDRTNRTRVACCVA